MSNKTIDITCTIEKTQNSSGNYNLHMSVESGEHKSDHHSELIKEIEKPMLEPNLDILCEDIKSIIRDKI